MHNFFPQLKLKWLRYKKKLSRAMRILIVPLNVALCPPLETPSTQALHHLTKWVCRACLVGAATCFVRSATMYAAMQTVTVSSCPNYVSNLFATPCTIRRTQLRPSTHVRHPVQLLTPIPVQLFSGPNQDRFSTPSFWKLFQGFPDL